jgi:hypothetical protein
MSTIQPTLAEIRQLFQETGQILKELSASQQETERRFQETERVLKANSLEIDRKLESENL